MKKPSGPGLTLRDALTALGSFIAVDKWWDPNTGCQMAVINI
jgi:hypothetical protein